MEVVRLVDRIYQIWGDNCPWGCYHRCDLYSRRFRVHPGLSVLCVGRIHLPKVVLKWPWDTCNWSFRPSVCKLDLIALCFQLLEVCLQKEANERIQYSQGYKYPTRCWRPKPDFPDKTESTCTISDHQLFARPIRHFLDRLSQRSFALNSDYFRICVDRTCYSWFHWCRQSISLNSKPKWLCNLADDSRWHFHFVLSRMEHISCETEIRPNSWV